MKRKVCQILKSKFFKKKNNFVMNVTLLLIHVKLYIFICNKTLRTNGTHRTRANKLNKQIFLRLMHLLNSADSQLFAPFVMFHFPAKSCQFTHYYANILGHLFIKFNLFVIFIFLSRNLDICFCALLREKMNSTIYSCYFQHYCCHTSRKKGTR